MGQPTDRQSLEDQMEENGRLPPEQILTKKFPVLHYGSIPPFDPQTWVQKAIDLFGLGTEAIRFYAPYVTL